VAIDYKLFSFAAPPLSGVDWFVKAAQLCGLGLGSAEQAVDPFPKRRSNILRVSLVMHPCDWLVSCYLKVHINGCCGLNLGSINTFRQDGSLGDFLRCYQKQPGVVGKFFGQYEADSCMRVEDMPWALMEQMKVFDVPRSMYRHLADIEGPKRPTPIYVRPSIRLSVMRAEEEFAERYNYH